MVLFKPSFFVQFVRKLETKLKCEVVLRKCSSRDLSVKNQIDQQSQVLNNVSKELEKPELKSISKVNISNHVLSNLKPEENSEQEQLSSLFDVQREKFYEDDYLHGFTPKVPKALDLNTEDLSDLNSSIPTSFNIASYADKNVTIQQLVKLGVKLWEFDKNIEIAQMLIRLDYKKDVQPYIRFLHDCGIPVARIGAFITNNPKIFKVDLDDLHTRIRYLRAHLFTPEMISVILTKNPQWLSYSTKEIDTRLGYFQHEFKLNAANVRLLALKMPKLITYDMIVLEKKTFAFVKEMGFSAKEVQSILMQSPRLWTRCRRNLVNSFDYAHNTMKLDHEIISKQPQILSCRKSRLESRHKFLVQLNRAQYDPQKPLYISPKALVSGTDSEFCENVAKTSTMTYNMFLKSL